MFLTFWFLLPFQNFAAAAGQDYDNPKVKPSVSANAIYALANRYNSFVLAQHFLSFADHSVIINAHKDAQILGSLFPSLQFHDKYSWVVCFQSDFSFEVSGKRGCTRQ